MAETSSKPIIMVSSVVYGYEDLLDRIYMTLSTIGYEVWMSHKGTMPVSSNLTAFENCLKAVTQCDLFLSLILPGYGTGKFEPNDDSIIHDELRQAIHLNKPRWVLAHDHVIFARNFLAKLGYATPKERASLTLKRNDFFGDLRIIDMYELAIRDDVTVYRDRKGNWVQKFGNDEEACLYVLSQFRRYIDAESSVKEAFQDIEASREVIDKQEKKGKEG